MALIRPCADLRNKYNEISKICHETKEPIYITKNGSSDLVILSNEVYESILETEDEKIEQALDEVDKNKCISMKNAMTEMEAKYGIHKKI